MSNESAHAPATWFVGATYGGTDDQLPRFLTEKIWENGYEDKHLDLVRSMRPGERIAVKAAYTRKYGLPFDNRGQSVSVISIKAIGVIKENLNDGRRVRVDWTKIDPPREWYFYTHRGTVWRVLPGDWITDGLIAFAFDGKPQDIDRFRNSPSLIERFGTGEPDKQRFAWTTFYEAVAEKLLDFRSNRSALVKGLRDIASRVGNLGYLEGDRYSDGTTGFVRDICPFTTLGIFNRGITEVNRRLLAGELAKFLGVKESLPTSFEGIPVLNNMKSCYFPFEVNRSSDHIDALWSVFSAGLKFADTNDDADRDAFVAAFDDANGRRGVAWNLTVGLYWAKPWSFPSLDKNSRTYIDSKLRITINRNGPKHRCSGSDYLAVIDVLGARFREAAYSVHSYPELSLEAWAYRSPTPGSADDEDSDDSDAVEVDEKQPALSKTPTPERAPIVPYTSDDLLKDGCFLEASYIDRTLQQLRLKKNLILQGPPGTGKTWLARRLAFALIGQKDESKVRVVQFHPNLSYEDFVRGWRPVGDGKLQLADGIFMGAIKAALKDTTSRHVVVIEEFNRGNPAQIFGELLTLLEAGKRSPDDGIELCYPDLDGVHRPIHIPENLYVIGTMNIADRSLALVDFALRRRFAFVDLEPRLGLKWQEFVIQKRAVDPVLAREIERRITELNIAISADPRLGKQFRIGHSYVTPDEPLEPGASSQWFRSVVETGIGPLLEEYWFDVPGDAKKAYDRLLQGL